LVAALEAAVTGSSLPVVIAAHSLGCALVAHWAQGSRHLAKCGCAARRTERRRGAQLPGRTDRLRAMPLEKLPFRASS